MVAGASRIVAVALACISLAGCSTMTAMQTTSTSSISQPMAAAPVRTQAPSAPPPSMKGMDFSQAVAALASTPGSGVTSVGRPTTALALVEEPAPSRPRSSKPKSSTPRRASVAAVAPVPAVKDDQAWVGPTVADPCKLVPMPAECVPTTVFGEQVAPVKRF